MSKFKLAIGLHNHQPVGNFDHIFEEAHKQAYSPFLNLLLKFDKIKISLHQSGILWVWQEKHHPEYLDDIRKMVERGQIELMTGGFYEPILPSIPDRDKLGQIDMLNNYLRKHFNIDCTGLWLTERVWEPHLPKVLHQAGVRYIPIDDTHFLYTGFELDDLKGIFITEEEGYVIKLLPIQKRLRYLIPFGTVEKVIDELKKQADINPKGLAIYADDGEKFGVWPKTYQHCYEEGWLEDFFSALSDNSDWLEVCTLGSASMTEPVGRAYLPTASYAEMLHWALPSKAFAEYEDFETWLKETGKLEKYGRYVRGGHWRGFLSKYDESNLMHKRMLAVSARLRNISLKRSDKSDIIEKAKDHLYAGQCNCPYWHGVFGGLYLPHLRQAIYENLIKADNLLNSLEKNEISKTETDFDCDGKNEIILQTSKFSAIFKPSYGGSLIELDCNEHNFNLNDTLTRRKEGYHWKLAKARLDDGENHGKTESIHDIILTKETGLEKILAEDWYLRRAFIDHFFTPQTEIDNFLSGKFGEEGDFILEPYEFIKDTDINVVAMKRNGHLWRPDGAKPLTVEKRFYFGENSEVISVNYLLMAQQDDIHNVRFAVENNFNFQAGHADDRYPLFNGEKINGVYLDSLIARRNCKAIVLRDEWRKLQVALSSDIDADVWQVPIFTISLSEGGFEKVYQGTSIVFNYNITLKKGHPFELTFLLFAGKPENMPNRFLMACLKSMA
jgi:alpha-amylase